MGHGARHDADVRLRVGVILWLVSWVPFAVLFGATGSTIVLIWTAVYAVLVATIGWLVPQGSVSAWLIPAAVFLIMPAVRIGLAPLAWEWNRHR